MALGHPAEAVPFLEASLALRRTEEITEPLVIATSERDLASALSAIGRNADAGRHMDVAIDDFRALGEPRRPFLVVALNRRASIAAAAGDPRRAVSVLRELLPLQDPASDEANATRITLADLLDNQAHRQEAAQLRDQALAIAEARHGEDSAAVVRIHLAVLASLRASGRLAQAQLAAWQCVDRSKADHDALLVCLMAQAETELAAGSGRTAVAVSAKAVVEAETHWTRDGGTVLRALMLQARAEAAVGDVDSVLRLYGPDSWLDPGTGHQSRPGRFQRGRAADAGRPTRHRGADAAAGPGAGQAAA